MLGCYTIQFMVQLSDSSCPSINPFCFGYKVALHAYANFGTTSFGRESIIVVNHINNQPSSMSFETSQHSTILLYKVIIGNLKGTFCLLLVDWFNNTAFWIVYDYCEHHVWYLSWLAMIVLIPSVFYWCWSNLGMVIISLDSNSVTILYLKFS